VVKPFKWAYNADEDHLDVWPVEGQESYARPQHGDRLTSEQYRSFYQGRIVLDGTRVVSFTFYDDRPYVGRTEDNVARAKNAIDAWVESL
jgi:hypothetical protein